MNDKQCQKIIQLLDDENNYPLTIELNMSIFLDYCLKTEEKVYSKFKQFSGILKYSSKKDFFRGAILTVSHNTMTSDINFIVSIDNSFIVADTKMIKKISNKYKTLFSTELSKLKIKFT